jgi:hypothetical protein
MRSSIFGGALLIVSGVVMAASVPLRIVEFVHETVGYRSFVDGIGRDRRPKPVPPIQVASDTLLLSGTVEHYISNQLRAEARQKGATIELLVSAGGRAGDLDLRAFADVAFTAKLVGWRLGTTRVRMLHRGHMGQVDTLIDTTAMLP